MTAADQRVQEGYAPVNELQMYWRSLGAGGTPLVVVHGGFGIVDMFGGVLGALAARRRVVARRAAGPRPHRRRRPAVHLRGASVTTWPPSSAHLGLGPVDLLGYSLGAGACAAGRDPAPRRGPAGWSWSPAPCRRDGLVPRGPRRAWTRSAARGFDDDAALADVRRLRRGRPGRRGLPAADGQDRGAAAPALRLDARRSAASPRPRCWSTPTPTASRSAHAAEFFALLRRRPARRRLGRRPAAGGGARGPAAAHPLRRVRRAGAGRRRRRVPRPALRVSAPGGGARSRA